MSWKNTPRHYGSLAIGLHWLMFLLMVGLYACIELRVLYPKGSDPREALKMWHFMLGLSVGLLVWLRLTVRLSNVKPAIEPAIAAWQKYLAATVHWSLYLLMIGMPLAGWFMLSAAGKPIPFFGWELPPLIGKNPELAKTIKEVHATVGTVGYYVIGLHVLAALYHQSISKDNTLLRMLPFRE